MSSDSYDDASDCENEAIAFANSNIGGRGKSVSFVGSIHHSGLSRERKQPSLGRSRSLPDKRNDYSNVPWLDFQKAKEQGVEHMFRNHVPADLSKKSGLVRRQTSPEAVRHDDDSHDSSSGDEGLSESRSLVDTDAVDKDVAIKNVVDAMRRNAEDAEEQKNGLGTLMELSTNDTYREIIGFHGGISVIVNALRAFPSEGDVQEFGLHLLVDLCIHSESNRKFAAQAEVAETLVMMLLRNRQRSKKKKLVSTLRALTHCCKQNMRSQGLAGACGGVGELIKTMTCSAFDSVVDVHCLRALDSISAQHEENIERVRIEDGVGAILGIMRRNRDCQITNELTTEILVHLLDNSEDTQIYIGKMGGVEDVLNALKLASGSEAAVTSACLCLRFLAFEEDNRRRMANLCGVKTIMKTAEAMKGSSAATIASILLALANGTFDDYISKSAAAKEGGVSTLVSIMAIHEEDTEVVEYACRVLRNISDSRQGTKRSCFKHGAVAAVAAAMKKHVDISGIQEHGAAMLINMMSSFSHAVRAAKLEEHIETIGDLHSLNEFTFTQVHHLGELLQSPTGLSGMIRKRAVDTLASLHSISSSTGGGNHAATLPSSANFHDASTLGHEKSMTAGNLSHLSSIESCRQKDLPLPSPFLIPETHHDEVKPSSPHCAHALSHHSSESIDY